MLLLRSKPWKMIRTPSWLLFSSLFSIYFASAHGRGPRAAPGPVFGGRPGTLKTGAMCLILVGIDMVSIVVTLIFGKDYIWPNIYNELVAFLLGSMQFLLGFCYVKNIWLLWFR